VGVLLYWCGVEIVFFSVKGHYYVFIYTSHSVLWVYG
jgi:hypothetical protein